MVVLRSFNPEIHHRRSIRLKGYDYSRPGYYLITLNTKNRENLFGRIDNGVVLLNPYGKILEATWHDLPNHNRNVILDAFVIMPDHFHGIILITMPVVPMKRHPLSEIIRQLKTFSARRINESKGTTGISVWQRDYYETIIRNHVSLEKIRNYIRINPRRCISDG